MALGGLAVGLALWQAQRVRQPGGPELSPEQWEQLRQRWARRQERAAAEAAQPPARRPVPPLPEGVAAEQMATYVAERPKSVLEVQPFRTTQRLALVDQGELDEAVLVDLNPSVNRWYVLSLLLHDGQRADFHLENGRPDAQDLTLDAAMPGGIVLVDTKASRPCPLWSAEARPDVVEAAGSGTPYVRLCGGEIALRLRTAGHKTALERTTDFLRDNVWRGEALTVFVRRTLFKDAFVQRGEVVAAEVPERTSADGPPPGRIEPSQQGFLVRPAGLGLELVQDDPSWMAVGRWYRKRGVPGVFVSALLPRLIASDILAGDRDVVGRLDEVEREALAYFVGFDLSRFELRFSIGTDHPRVGWSERVLDSVRDPGLPGPDGFDTVEPLIATGIIGPSDAARTVAAFTGGFKRSHGAFKVGSLATQSAGSHYGFIDSGAILSKLVPGLATVYMLVDGSVGMKTWAAQDDALLPRIAFARQNGVPLLETDPETGSVVPGRLVSRWAAGNWSGSADGKLRTLRAGICLVEEGDRRFLLYGYFTGATPSAMVRGFEAYGCSYAMLTDMNALEHTYLAVYRPGEGSLSVEHLMEEMSVLDVEEAGELVPRFLGFADNRDFFYLVSREKTR